MDKSFGNAARSILSFGVRFAWVRWLLSAWYRAALHGLRWSCKGRALSEIKVIYCRHQNWILGISDIDLIVLFNGARPASEQAMLQAFWRRYRRVRWFFPMLCGVSEIRWIALENLPAHPLNEQPEARLLLNPEQWVCVYRQAAAPSAAEPVFDPPATGAPPFTMFLDFNLYGYLQKQLFANEDQPALRVDRMAKCAIKSLQHGHFVNTGSYVPVVDIQQRLAAPTAEPWQRYSRLLDGLLTPPVEAAARDRGIARSLHGLLRELDRVHAEHLPRAETNLRPPNRMPGEWAGTPLERFLQESDRTFGAELPMVAFRSPYKQYHARVFALIEPGSDFDTFYAFVQHARRYHADLAQQRAILAATTPGLLASQHRFLWGHVALEAYILEAQGVHSPRRPLELASPKPAWTLQKIRESVAVFEEFYLPFLTAPEARGSGMDFCKIYERAETEMLFHYYGYLRDREGYLEVLRRSDGSMDEVISWGCAHFGNEIGIQHWHPYRFVDAYPCLKPMIRQIDSMALQQLEAGR